MLQPNDITVLVPGDVIIGSNASMWQNGGIAWKSSIGSTRYRPLPFAAIPREGATLAALDATIATYPQRLCEAVEYTYRFANSLHFWDNKSIDDMVNIHKDVVLNALINEGGFSEHEANTIALQYKDEILKTGIRRKTQLIGCRAGMSVIAATAKQKVAETLQGKEALQAAIVPEPPLHRLVFNLNLNGKLVASDDYYGAQAVIYAQSNIATPFDAQNLTRLFDQLRINAKDHVEDLMSGKRLGGANTIEEAITLNRAYGKNVADFLHLNETNTAQFTAEYSHSLEGLSLEQLQDADRARKQVFAQIDRRVDAIASVPEKITVQAKALRNEYYARFTPMRERIQREVAAIANEMGVEAIVKNIRFELAEGHHIVMGGTVGAEANVATGCITISHTMLDGTITDAQLRSNLREEIRHTIDLTSGVSDKHWRYINALLDDDEKHKVWHEFDRAKNKQPPAYYKEFGHLETEFMADLLDMRDNFMAELGTSEQAQERIHQIFGEEAVAMLAEYDSAAQRMNAELTAHAVGPTQAASDEGNAVKRLNAKSRTTRPTR